MSARVLICGARNWSNAKLVREELKKHLPIDCVIEGEAWGADTIGRQIAESMGIDVLAFPANWSKYGRAAGPIRNKQMLTRGKPTLVLAFHNDLENSKGTKDMVRQARKAGVEVIVISENSMEG